jgi:hypothetical protein
MRISLTHPTYPVRITLQQILYPPRPLTLSILPCEPKRWKTRGGGERKEKEKEKEKEGEILRGNLFQYPPALLHILPTL